MRSEVMGIAALHPSYGLTNCLLRRHHLLRPPLAEQGT